MPLLKDLIHIPERVHQGDFVLKLSEGRRPSAEQTLRDYVVTPQLVDAFDNALGFIQQAVQTGGSKAAYLHGSFGSRQEPLHGGAEPAAGRQHAGARRCPSWPTSWRAQRLDARAASSCSCRTT